MRGRRAQAPPRPEVRELGGYPAAIEGLGSVAAPLLAGFSLTVVVYALSATSSFRWPDAVLALIFAAALALITTVQCTMTARLYAASPETPASERARLAAAHRRWARRAERLYNAGILLLLCGVTVALVPPGPAGELGARLVAIAVGLFGLAGAALWMAAAHPPARWIAGRFVDEPAQETRRRETTKEAA